MSHHSTTTPPQIKKTQPTHHRALLVRALTTHPKVETLPLPTPQPGTAILHILATSVLSYAKDVFLNGGPRNYTFPFPLIPGYNAIARVSAVAPDATSLEPGQLVLYDCFTLSRDLDANGRPAAFLAGVFDGLTDRSKSLMRHSGFGHGSTAEYMRAPLENCYVLDETTLLRARNIDQGLDSGLGYLVSDLCVMATLAVPFGGFRSVNLRAGELILISPATGQFGGVACMLALALGVKVVAWGRNTEKLARLKEKLSNICRGRYRGMINTVPLTANPEVDLVNLKKAANNGDAHGKKGFDVFFDISPPAAGGSHHIKTGILATRPAGRVSLMGGMRGDVAIPHHYVMHFDIEIRGKWMYARGDVVELIGLVERGVLVLGREGGWTVIGDGEDGDRGRKYGLDDWEEAWEEAYVRTGVGEMVVIMP